MKLIILHGNGQTAISNRIMAIKKSYDSVAINEYKERDITWSKLGLEILSPQLFSEKRLVIIEDLNDNVDLSQLVGDEYLTIILRFSKPLPKSSKILKEAINLKAEIINLTESEEVSIFPFLDALIDRKQLVYNQLDGMIDNFGTQYLLTMIFYQLRKLIAPSKGLPPFVIKKINAQRQHFTVEKISELYKETLEIDYKIKRGEIDDLLGLTLLINRIITI